MDIIGIPLSLRPSVRVRVRRATQLNRNDIPSSDRISFGKGTEREREGSKEWGMVVWCMQTDFKSRQPD